MIEAKDVRLTQYSKGGGCGCKIAPAVLQQMIGGVQSNNEYAKLLVGNSTADDAAVYDLGNGTALISTTDFFLPIVDNAFDFGRIAAANAISDVYAMGGKPLMALAVLGFPVETLPIETAQEILRGSREVCAAAGMPLAGGHTIESSDPIFGLCVSGTAPVANIKTNSGAQVGDLLLLTKPLGTGILSTAVKRGLLQPQHYNVLLQQLTALNKIGEALGAITGVHAVTDVTGFGLAGHALEMARGSGVGMQLYYNRIQKAEGVDEYMKQRISADATFRNWNSYSKDVQFEKARPDDPVGRGVHVMEAFSLLPDPQTNGGLLIAVAPDDLQQVQELFRKEGLENFTEPVGVCTTPGEKLLLVTND